MNLDRKQIKAETRAAMREMKPSIYLTTLVYLVLILVLEFLSARLQNPELSLGELLRSGGFSAEDAYYLRPNMRLIPALLVAVIALMQPVLDMGYKGICLWTSRRVSTGVGGLFEGFEYPFKVIWLNIVMGFFIFLWSLLLVAPGIVASYRYSMAPYILLQDPDKSALQCIRESKALTRGHKWELFVLDLSFLGWTMLCAIPGVLIYVQPYIEVTHAAFFNALSGFAATQSGPEAPPSGDDWWAQQ